MHFTSPAGLDDFVNRYNASRGAEQGIENFSLNGWEVGYYTDLNSDKISSGFMENGFMGESQYSFMEVGYFQSSKAQGLELTSGFQEDLRIRVRGGYLGGGASIMNHGDFQLAGGFRTYIGLIKAHNRVADATTINDMDWTEGIFKYIFRYVIRFENHVQRLLGRTLLYLQYRCCTGTNDRY